MIKTIDLRIGSFIYDDEGIISKVVGFKPFEHSVRCDEEEGCDLIIVNYAQDDKIRGPYDVDSNLVQPVPLTVDWLAKCGFINGGYHDGGNSSWKHPDFPFGLTDTNKAPGFLVYYFDDHDCVYPAEVDFVHELQNLFYDHTKKELTFNF